MLGLMTQSKSLYKMTDLKPFFVVKLCKRNIQSLFFYHLVDKNNIGPLNIKESRRQINTLHLEAFKKSSHN